MEITDPHVERIFLDALASYADACKLPELTRTCPFYRVEDGHPTCGEECRGILESSGIDDRPVIETPVGGLRMTGRQLPISVAAGVDEFDATKKWLNERELPVEDQSTSALLIGLRIAARWNLGRGIHDASTSMKFWGELLRRGVDMDRVFRGGVAPELAEVAMLRGVAEILTRNEIVDASAFLSDQRPTNFPLADLVDAVLADLPPDPHSWMDSNLGYVAVIMQQSAPLSDPAPATGEILQRPDVQFVLSQGFFLRMQEWYSGLVEHDLEAALRAELPPPHIFVSTPGRPRSQTMGLWIWERFTLTDLAMWDPSSLLLEWQWARGATTDACRQRTLNERQISVEKIGLSAMEAFEYADSEEREENLFQPAKYTQLAVNHLAAGEWEKAASIFEGLTELSPGDGEAWNNLGFCLLGKSAQLALPHLDKGASLQHPAPIIQVANQVLALHLLGRDEEALNRADRCLATDQIDEFGTATVWMHPTGDGELELGWTAQTRTYLEDLRVHIATDSCALAGIDSDA